MVMAGEDDSMVLAGSTRGNWSGTNLGGAWDLAAVKLDSEGEELWRWQVSACHDTSRLGLLQQLT